MEIVRLNLESWTLGHRIQRFLLIRASSLSQGRADCLAPDGLEGARITGLHRRGKALYLDTDGPCALLMRFGMTGKWVVGRAPTLPPHARAALWVVSAEGAEQRIDFLDMRCFGTLLCVPAGQGQAILRQEVPGMDALREPLGGIELQALHTGMRTPIKVALLDQARVAGLGNIYAAEVLFRAGISPKTPAGALGLEAWSRLAALIPAILQEYLDKERAEEVVYQGEAGAVNPFQVYGREGAPCGRCGQRILRFVQAGRSTFCCPGCQV